jgi:hypothetical protein
MLRKEFIEHIERRFGIVFVEYKEEYVRAQNFYVVVRINRVHVFKGFMGSESHIDDVSLLEEKIQKFAMDYFGKHIEAKVWYSSSQHICTA